MPTLMTPSMITIIDPVNPAGPRVNAYAWSRSDNEVVEGQVNKYAYGRRVSIRYGDIIPELSFSLLNLTEADHTLMKSWLGKITLLRDRHGRKVFGTYFQLAVVDFRDSARDLSFKYEQVSFIEAV